MCLANNERNLHSRSRLPFYSWYYLFTVSNPDLLASTIFQIWFSRFTLSPSAKKEYFPTYDLDLYELHLESVKLNCHAKYLGGGLAQW